ncbi:MAG: hypothetical protein KGL35_17015 [Bradyrhizobium sp.]|nr:hypothetical protein [Bradyrhizobium sp.]
MIRAEARGQYDFSREKDALVVSNETGLRVALFLDGRRKRDVISVSVDLPDSKGTRCYAVDFDWLVDHLCSLEPNNAA